MSIHINLYICIYIYYIHILHTHTLNQPKRFWIVNETNLAKLILCSSKLCDWDCMDGVVFFLEFVYTFEQRVCGAQGIMKLLAHLDYKTSYIILVTMVSLTFLVGGDWNMTFIFPYIWNVIITFDEIKLSLFFRGMSLPRTRSIDYP